MLPAWAVLVLAAALLLAPVLTVIDGAARLRRRRVPLARQIGWVVSLAAPVALAALFAYGLGLAGVVDATAPPAPAGAIPLDGDAWIALGCTALVLGLGFLVLRPFIARLVRAPGPPFGPAAALAPVLVVCALGVLACALNPYVALLLVLPANLWLLIAAPEVRMRRPLALAVVLLSLVPVVLVFASYAVQLDLGPAEGAWFWLLAAAGGQGGIVTLLGWSIGAGAALAALVLALRPPEPDDHPVDGAITVRGPASYAGPGSLGGTDSAMRSQVARRAVRSDVR